MEFGVAVVLVCSIGLTSSVVRLGTEDFHERIPEQSVPQFIMFFAPWCEHCRRLSPIWEDLATTCDQQSLPVSLAKVDCTQDTQLCVENGVMEYPTLKLYRGSSIFLYQGPRNVRSFIDFLYAPEEEQTTVLVDRSGLAHLTDKNFQHYLNFLPGVHFVEFYAPWCSHCKNLAPTWETLATHFQALATVHISLVDCTEEIITCQKLEIVGYPTLLLFTDDSTWKTHSGSRDLQSLVEFVIDNSPQDIFSVIQLTGDSFEAVIGEGLVFILYYTSQCSRCKRSLSTWEELSKITRFSATLAKVDCSAWKKLCDQEGVHDMPTMVLYKDGFWLKEYHGKEEVKQLAQFLIDSK